MDRRAWWKLPILLLAATISGGAGAADGEGEYRLTGPLASENLAVYFIHRFASRALRRGPAWGCGFSDATPAAQYSGVSFAQPIRRVFGTLVFHARDHVMMPPPGDLRPARLRIELHDLVWNGMYAPIADAVGFSSSRLNRLQFLTIRRYLSLVFATLVTLLLVLAIWS